MFTIDPKNHVVVTDQYHFYNHTTEIYFRYRKYNNVHVVMNANTTQNSLFIAVRMLDKVEVKIRHKDNARNLSSEDHQTFKINFSFVWNYYSFWTINGHIKINVLNRRIAKLKVQTFKVPNGTVGKNHNMR